ncbi:B12-binding domain-containing radical SAM protein [Pelosinus sp. sgz500959]|uniref:B12-binding domain-containing radical SAM protein n=1 Tax=Pelosinus sp. sgz500959 TaxID=3242472 RepID=UPI0036731554
MKVVLSTLNAKFIHSSFALKYLEAACRPVCPKIMSKEYTINNELLNILSDIYSQQPDLIGLACYIWNVDMTLKLARLLKKVLPHVTIVLGGPEVSYDPAELMSQHDCVDYIVQGEGEETLQALLKALKSNQSVEGIPGLTFRQQEEIIVGEPQVIRNLDTIPFPYCDADIDKLKDKIIYYESARGCPFSCKYCLSSATAGVRFFSLERVYEDLKFFIAHNVRQVKFVDRTFNARKEHYLPILRFLAKQNCRTNFHFEISADILDDEVLEFLKDVPVGRFQFEIGIQSTYEPTLTKISRHNNWPKIVEYVTKIISYKNIHVHLDLIVGLPKESYAQFGKSFNDVYELQPHMLQIGFLKLLKGAGIRENADESKYIFLDYAPYEVLANDCLTYGDVRKLKILEEVFNQVYNTGRFNYTLQFLISLHGEDAFGFYHDLASYWEERELHLVAHSSKSLYKYLLDFYRIHHEHAIELVQEFLKFDALMSEKGSLRPEILSWNKEMWTKEKNAFWASQEQVRKYLPKYTFTTWRDVNKKYHIEVFSIDILEYVRTRTITKRELPILFSYEEENTMYQSLTLHDFWQGGDRN